VAIDLIPDERWKNAKKFADGFKQPITMFATAIRAIKSAELHQGGDTPTVRKVVVQTTQFVLDVSPSLKALFYFAAEDLHPEHIADYEELDSRTLLKLFKPSEVAAILAISFVYRNVRRMCPESEWKKIAAKLYTYMHVSTLVGETINHVGPGNGMLMGGLRHLSMAMFAARDLKGFQEYARRLKTNASLFDLDFEEERWGCNHLEIAAIISQMLGFGVQASTGLSLAYLIEGNNLPEDLEELVFCWRACMDWTTSFIETGEPPENKGEGDAMYLPENELKNLKKHVAEALDEPFMWLERTKGDLTPEQCTRLGLNPSISKQTEPDPMDDEEAQAEPRQS
jgi:hypothetical protein